MTTPNFGLLGGNNALQMFGVGAQMGQQIRQRQEDRRRDEALATYAANPDAPDSVNALLKVDPRLALQVRGQQQQQAAQQQEQRRADMPLIGKLLEYSKDENTYQQARQVAAQYGIDTSQLPPTFDPNWIAQQRQVVGLLSSPQGQEALSTAGKQAMDMGYQPGTPEFTQVTRQLVEAALAQPFTGQQGETRLYTPQIGGSGQIQGAVPYNPDEWEVVEQGGPTPPASAGFRP